MLCYMSADRPKTLDDIDKLRAAAFEAEVKADAWAKAPPPEQTPAEPDRVMVIAAYVNVRRKVGITVQLNVNGNIQPGQVPIDDMGQVGEAIQSLLTQAAWKGLLGS